MSTDFVLYLLAFLAFIVAAVPFPKGGVAFEWVAAALLVLSLLI